MAKKVFSTQIECLQANKGKNGAQIMFANNVQQTKEQVTAREVVNISTGDTKVAEALTPGKKYTVTITEE